MTHYIGICKSSKESGITLLKDDGKIKNIFVEERFNRKKYFDGCPTNSLLKLVTIVNDDFKVGKYNKKDLENNDKLIKNANISFIDTQIPFHHLCHAYESFYTSGFERAAILVVDGYGENSKYGIDQKESITLYIKNGKEIKELKKYYYPNSLGLFYSKGGRAFRFKENEEGHFMGITSYGKPFEERILSICNGQFQYHDDITKLSEKYYTERDSLNIINSFNYAATVQRDLNECVIELVKDIKNMVKEDNLCLSGGVFNNVITNNVICESEIFKNVWCSPAPGDFGISIGQAYITYEADVKDLNFHRLDNAYKGIQSAYSDEKVFETLKGLNINYCEITYDKIVDMLCAGKVLAWFQGASEFGRRALGHRSLIANPEYPHTYGKLSIGIKKRAPYRPLACTVPDELFDLMFDVKNKDLTEYMLRAIPIRYEMRKKVAACTHVDGTTRPQRLRREVNPEFYDMIMEFYKRTNVPCVVNTSLNGGGEPIVESIVDLCEFLYNYPDVEGAVINGKFYIRVR